MNRCLTLLAVVAVTATGLLAGPAGAQSAAPGTSPTVAQSAAPGASPSVAASGAAASPSARVGPATKGAIQLIPLTPDASVRIDARYLQDSSVCPAKQPPALHAAYNGTLEIGRRSNGRLYLIAEMTFPEYLNGIAEVPTSWPPEALKAQVVASRTYAIAHMNPSTALARELKFNLCATDQCQVFRGLNISAGPWGDTWKQAVAATTGEILEYNKKPAQTYYFSTSNGHTYSNAEVFGGAALPYLKPVVEKDDTGSSLSSWSVSIPLADLAEILRLSKTWGVEAIATVVQKGDQITLTGGGKTVNLSIDDLRSKLNSDAVCLTPKRYPSPAPNGKPYPQTMPSKWATLKQNGDAIVITGRGWGHGVGMVQWGLKGKADRGVGYADMLSYYYGGLKPVKRQEPDRIRVLLSSDIADLTLERRGAYTVEGPAIPDGPVVLTGGDTLAIAAGSPISATLKVDKASYVAPPGPADPFTFNFELSDPANLHLEYHGAKGVTGLTSPEPRDPGPQSLTWDPVAAGLKAGSYQVSLVADNGVDEARSQAMKVSLAGPSPSPSPQATSRPQAAAPSTTPPWLVPALIALVVVVGLVAGIMVGRFFRRIR
jgi:SpoIID/LytB domain protein